MATVTAFTAERTQEIEDAAIVDAAIVGGELILTKHDGSTINLGSVMGPQGDPGAAGPSSLPVAKAGTLVGSRGRINLIEGTGISITATDDAGNDEVDVSISSSTPPFIGALAYRSSGAGIQSIPNNTWTSILLDTESFDSSAFHSTVSQTSRMTVPAGKGGKYIVIDRTEFASNATGRRMFGIAVNGTIVASVEATPAAALNLVQPCVEILSLAPGDYVESQVLQSSGAALNADGGFAVTSLSLVLIGV